MKTNKLELKEQKKTMLETSETNFYYLKKLTVWIELVVNWKAIEVSTKSTGLIGIFLIQFQLKWCAISW